MTDISQTIAATPEDKPPTIVFWLGGLLVSAGFVISALIHMALLSVVVLANPDVFEGTPENTMMVDIVASGEIPSPAKKDVADPAINKSELRMDDNPSAASAAKRRQQQTAQPEQPSLQSAQQQTQTQQSAPVSEAAATAARIAEMAHLPNLNQLAGFDARPAEMKAGLTADEVAAFKSHLKKCWSPPAGIPSDQKLRAVLRIALRPSGQLSASPTLLAASASQYGPALVESAKVALRKCQPYSILPADKYPEWKLLDLNFSADDVAGVTSGTMSAPAPGSAPPPG